MKTVHSVWGWCILVSGFVKLSWADRKSWAGQKKVYGWRIRCNMSASDECLIKPQDETSGGRKEGISKLMLVCLCATTPTSLHTPPCRCATTDTSRCRQQMFCGCWDQPNSNNYKKKKKRPDWRPVSWGNRDLLGPHQTGTVLWDMVRVWMWF